MVSGEPLRRCAIVRAVAVVGAFGICLAAPVTGFGAASTTPQSKANWARGLDALPFPGTPDAPPGTPIDFPAIAPGQIVVVHAVGSRSGVHAGRLSAQPQSRGTRFAPDRPFSPGERVSVTLRLRTVRAGAASGDGYVKTLRFSFSIARAATVAPPPRPAAAGGAPTKGRAGAHAKNASRLTTHSFVTRPDFHPPIVRFRGKDTDPGSGDIFLNAQNTGQNAAYFLTPGGKLRWYHPTTGPGHGKGPAAFDVRVQRYRKHPYLTYWVGHLTDGYGVGVGAMVSEHYRRVHTITAGAGYQRNGIDLHEFWVSPQGDAFVTVYAPVHANLTSVGGPSNGTVIDSIAQEINIATNRVVWEWNALAHVPVSASYAPYIPGLPYDYFHMNSIQELPDGRLLISARNTSAVYSIDMKTGKIAWELSGRHPSFRMGRGTRFFWQHDAQLNGGGLLTVFDDGAGDGRTRREADTRARDASRH